MPSISRRIFSCSVIILLLNTLVILDATDPNTSIPAAQISAEIDVPLAGQSCVLRTFRASSIPRNALPDYDNYVRINQSDAVGRIRMPLSREQLGNLKPPSTGGNETSISINAPVIDVWKLAENIKAPTDASISIDFDVISEKNTSMAIGVGACDEIFVFSNGEPVHGMVGHRDLVRNQNLIAITLVPGRNQIKIIARKASPWSQIPAKHSDNCWELRLELFGSVDYAYKVYRKTSFHILDTPIVTSAESLRLDAVIGNRNEISILNVMDGTEYSRGTGNADGSIKWEFTGGPSIVPLLGLLVVNNCNAEPILIVPADLSATLVAGISPPIVSSPEIGIWAYRAAHLLDSKANYTRDTWWARKLTTYLLKANEDRWPQKTRAAAANCKLTKINFHSYVSRIDGSRQFYRSYSSEDQTTNPILVVSVPGVNRPVRPYLESYSLADELDTECLAASIEEAGVNVIWPGLIDVDYGGEYAVTDLHECINNAQQGFSPTLQTYLVATCSAAVSSINFAMEHPNLAGVILNIPELRRSYKIWNPGLPITDHYNNRPHHVNTIPQIAAALRNIPLFIQWDLQLAGHGDREGTRELCELMKKQGSEITSLWPEPKDYAIYGESYRQESENWLSWILQKKSKNHGTFVTKTSIDNLIVQKNVKSELLKGFEIELPHNSNAIQYLEFWNSVAHFYRGHSWENVNASDRPIPKKTLVKFRSASAETCNEAFALSADAIPQTSDALWGFKLVQESDSRVTIEILSTSPTIFPRIDILLSGECQGELWMHSKDSWNLVKTLE